MTATAATEKANWRNKRRGGRRGESERGVSFFGFAQAEGGWKRRAIRRCCGCALGAGKVGGRDGGATPDDERSV